MCVWSLVFGLLAASHAPSDRFVCHLVNRRPSTILPILNGTAPPKSPTRWHNSMTVGEFVGDVTLLGGSSGVEYPKLRADDRESTITIEGTAEMISEVKSFI